MLPGSARIRLGLAVGAVGSFIAALLLTPGVRAQEKSCTTMTEPSGRKTTICVDKPTRPSSGGGNSSGGSSEGGSSGGGSSGGGGTSYVGPSKRDIQRTEALQAADSWEALGDRALRDRQYEEAIRLYDKALDVYYTSNRKTYYENAQLNARRLWFEEVWDLAESAKAGGRDDEVSRRLGELKRIWYTKSLQQYIDAWDKRLAERRNADREERRATDAARRNANDTRRALERGDWRGAARLLDNAMTAEGISNPDGSIETSVVDAATQTVGRPGIQAFRQFNAEFHAFDSPQLRLLGGSLDGDTRYGRLKDIARQLPAAVTSQSAGSSDLREVLSSVTTRLDELRDDSARTAKELADVARQAVLRVSARVMEIGRVPGESDRDTIAFVREIRQTCAARRDEFCAAGEARGVRDRADNPARRNGEHFLFAYDLTVFLRNKGGQYGGRSGAAAGALTGAAAGVVLTPIYSLVKAVDQPRFPNSRPSAAEIWWGECGAVAGLFNQVDPTRK